MSGRESSEKRLAVLIDADNAQPSIIDGLLAEISKHGVASVKRIYGDWTKPILKSWKDVLLKHAIQPIQQFSYTKGKNATDMAMIIDAMDLLYSNRFDAFCIVSSDSDFTRLASRVREAGLLVYGFGEKKTPQAFVSACDKFIYTEILSMEDEPSRRMKPKNIIELKRDTRLVNLLRGAVESAADDSGWANLATVGNKIVNQAPEFDSRNYGYVKLGELIEASQLFDIDIRTIGKEGHKVTYVRDKRKE
ncbi:MAG: NYN domain-containing protein [Nitrospirae bacterium]|nr:NYN domain-containing protein [Nitrospirota bacterium]